MQTKLTLRLDEELIQHAKALAKRTGKSLSQIVAEYFSLLHDPPKKRDLRLTPIVRSLKGALRGANMRAEDYHRYLKDKYS